MLSSPRALNEPWAPRGHGESTWSWNSNRHRTGFCKNHLLAPRAAHVCLNTPAARPRPKGKGEHDPGAFKPRQTNVHNAVAGGRTGSSPSAHSSFLRSDPPKKAPAPQLWSRKEHGQSREDGGLLQLLSCRPRARGREHVSTSPVSCVRGTGPRWATNHTRHASEPKLEAALPQGTSNTVLPEGEDEKCRGARGEDGALLSTSSVSHACSLPPSSPLTCAALGMLKTPSLPVSPSTSFPPLLGGRSTSAQPSPGAPSLGGLPQSQAFMTEMASLHQGRLRPTEGPSSDLQAPPENTSWKEPASVLWGPRFPQGLPSPTETTKGEAFAATKLVTMILSDLKRLSVLRQDGHTS